MLSSLSESGHEKSIIVFPMSVYQYHYVICHITTVHMYCSCSLGPMPLSFFLFFSLHSVYRSGRVVTNGEGLGTPIM